MFLWAATIVAFIIYSKERLYRTIYFHLCCESQRALGGCPLIFQSVHIIWAISSKQRHTILFVFEEDICASKLRIEGRPHKT